MTQRARSFEDIHLGMCFYSIPETWGYIPHFIKFSPDTFKVEEIINLDLIGSSGYFLYRVEKDWGVSSSHLEALLSKYPAVLIGKKDKLSKAIQYVISKVPIDRSGFVFVGRISKDIPISLLHIGNRFTISVKIDESFIGEVLNRVNILKKHNIFNYYGYQRFGVRRKNHIIGYRLLKDPTQLRTVKQRAKMKLYRLYINSVQSYIFNHTVNAYIHLNEENEERSGYDSLYRIEIPNGKKVPALPIIGYSLINPPEYITRATYRWGLTWREIRKKLYNLKRFGIDLYGSLRPLYIYFVQPPKIEGISDEELRISFTLLRGQYATVVLRELFRPLEPRKLGY